MINKGKNIRVFASNDRGLQRPMDICVVKDSETIGDTELIYANCSDHAYVTEIKGSMSSSYHPHRIDGPAIINVSKGEVYFLINGHNVLIEEMNIEGEIEMFLKLKYQFKHVSPLGWKVYSL